MTLYLIGTFVFVAIVVAIVSGWLMAERRRDLTVRLSELGETRDVVTDALVRERQASGGWRGWLRMFALYDRLSLLSLQAGRGDDPTDTILLVLTCALAGIVLGWLRVASVVGGLVCGGIGGAVPILVLAFKRQTRLRRFESQLADALDLMTRSLRAGHALGAALEQVAENSAEPTAGEFRRLAEEMRLGLDPSAALAGLETRIPTTDTRFFSTAIRIQRATGGNLAETLERLAEIVRDRFRLLSQARALAAQHKWSAILVGLSPAGFAVIFGLMQPGYFDPLLDSPVRNLLLGTGFLFEFIGFVCIWRIARIEV